MPLDRNRLLKPVKKLRKIINKMPSQPAPGKVHDLRTNARRFEAVFAALSLDAQGIGESLLKCLGRLRKRAGKVRDMDVLINYASTVHPDGEEECLMQLLEHLGYKRRRYARKLHSELRGLRSALRKDLKHTTAVLAKLIRKNDDGARVNAAGAAATGTAVKLVAELAIPRRLSSQNLHPYRLKVKELRNVLQMAAAPARPKLVDALGEVKDAIGEWHDWEELVSMAQKVLDHGKGCELMAELKRIARRKYVHALALAERLRARYLRNAPRLTKGAPAASLKIPAAPALQATAILAG